MELLIDANFCAAMAVAGSVIEALFGLFHLVPHERAAKVVEASIRWNYTTFLNLAFLALALVLIVRFVRTGGLAMLRMMGGGPEKPPGPPPQPGHADLRNPTATPRAPR